jgi:hypothetical protein
VNILERARPSVPAVTEPARSCHEEAGGGASCWWRRHWWCYALLLLGATPFFGATPRAHPR